jgi:transcription antitermination factor NusG
MMEPNRRAYDHGSRWFAVWTRSRQEKVVAAAFDKLDVRHYLPLKSELRQWSDRKQIVETPLFSGYLFVQISLLTNSRLQVLKVPGVGALVSNQTGPLPIPDRQIEDIRRLMTAGVECAIQPLLNVGDRVRVVRGPLTGIEGILVRTQSTSRLVISIEMIRQSLSVSIERSDVELIRPDRSIEMHCTQTALLANQY